MGVVTVIEVGMVKVTRRVLPTIVVTAVACVVALGPALAVAGSNVTWTWDGLIVPVGKLVPVTLMVVTPGWPAVGDVVGGNVT